MVSVDPPEVQSAFRAGLGARFAFLSDAERRWLDRLGLCEGHRHAARPLQAGRFTLYPDLTIHAAYNGYWYLGRATSGGAAPGSPCDLPGVRDEWELPPA